MQPSSLGPEYNQMLDSLPASESQILSAARSLQIDGDTARACKLLEQAVARRPSVILRKSLAALHLQHGHFEASVRVTQNLLADRPSDLPAILLLTEAQIRAGQFDNARSTLERAAGLGADQARLADLRDHLERAASPPDADLRTSTVPSPLLTHRSQFGESPDTTPPQSDEVEPVPPPIPDSARTTADMASESALFEDGTFSDLSADPADDTSTQQRGEVYATQPDTYDDSAERSFDDLLVDLGVPVDTGDTVESDKTSSLPRPDDLDGVERPPPASPGHSDYARPDDPTEAISFDDFDEAGDPGTSNEASEFSPPAPGRSHPSQSTGARHSQSAGGDAVDSTEMTQVDTVAEQGFADDLPMHPDSPERRGGPASIAPSGSATGATQSDQPPQQPSGDAPAFEQPAYQSAAQRPLDSAGSNQQAPVANPSHPHRPESPQSNSSTHTPQRYVRILAAIAVGAVVILVAVAFAASSSAASAVEAKLERYRDQTAPDTYEGYLAGEQSLQKALEQHSFFGETIDAAVGAVGFMEDARLARQEALAEQVNLEAMIEYRYEYLGAHDSKKFIDRAKERLDGDPRLDLARAYRLLAGQRPYRAAAILKTVRQNAPKFGPSLTASLRAAIATGNLKTAASIAEDLEALDTLNVHQRYVLGLVELHRNQDSADGRFDEIIHQASPDHLSARIARSYSIRRGEADEDTLTEASTLLDEVLKSKRSRASPLQVARAHVARGDLYTARDQPGRAEEQFRKAISTVPTRSSIYTPLIEVYTDDGRLTKAVDLIDKATSRGATSPALVQRRAAIFRLTGRPEAALRALSGDSAGTLWQKGMALLDLHRLDEAARAFADADAATDNRRRPRARAYQLATKELMSVEKRKRYAAELDELLEAWPTNPHVLRAAALAAMHVARVTESRTSRRDLLDRAGAYLDAAIDGGGNQALLLYDRCRQQMLAAKATEAAVSCRKAKRINPRYLLGLLTMADLELRRGHPDAVVDLMSEAADQFPNQPQVDEFSALGHARRFEFQQARDLLNRWAGTPTAKTVLYLRVEGELAFAQNRYTRAIGYFKRAHDKAPTEALPALLYSHALTRLGSYEPAEQLLEAHLTDLEWEPMAWLIFGELRRRQGRLSDARENLGLALEKFGDAIGAPRQIARVYTQLALTWAARSGFDHRYVRRYLSRGAERGDPTFPPLNAARGAYYLQRDDPDPSAAADAFEKVVEFEPFNCPALDQLESIYDQQDASDDRERIEALQQEHCKD